MSEKRNLSFANGADWASIFAGYNTKAGTPINENSAQRISTVHQCLDVVSRTVASFPWRLMESVNGIKSNAQNRPESKLLKQRPHKHYSSHIFRKILVTSMMSKGAGAAKILQEGSRITGYELRNVSNILPVVSPKTDELYYYDYHDNEITHSDDMIYVLAHSRDGVTPLSIINLHRDGLGTAAKLGDFASDFWKNGTFINGFLETDTTLTPDQKLTIRNEVIQGLGRNGGIGFLEYGMKFKGVGMAMKDAEFIAFHNHTVTDICRMFGVPPWMVGHYANANFNSSEQMVLSFVNNTVRPYAHLIDEEFTYKSFQNRGLENVYSKLEMKGLLQGDIKSRADFNKTMLGLGVYDIDEVRSLEDLNPLPDDKGKTRLVPSNMISLDYVEEFSKSLADKIAAKMEQAEKKETND